MHQLTIEGRSYLFDCGSYQGWRQEAAGLNKSFPLPPKELSAVLLPSAHIEPLHTAEDAETTYPLFHPCRPGLKYRSFEVGPMLGSKSMVLDLESGGSKCASALRVTWDSLVGPSFEIPSRFRHSIVSDLRRQPFGRERYRCFPRAPGTIRRGDVGSPERERRRVWL
jgi:hypothetical protein